ncbi:MAG: hypothetical protein JWO06_750 [Bacteroidota bacterium]|nr:hypothetical protein [Bacteroidota bacterium]
MKRKDILFYLLACVLLGLVFLFFSNAYRQLVRYSELANRNSIVYTAFQHLSKEINNAAVINPDLLKANESSKTANLFFTDSMTVITRLDYLKSVVRDSINIKIADKLNIRIRSELSWMLRSNVPDSIIHHRSPAHIAAIQNIDSLINQGIARTDFLLQNHKKALNESINQVRAWMIVFILLSAFLLIYTTINLRRQKSKTASTEKELELTEKQFRHTLDNMLEGAQIHDFNWRYTYVNKALVKYSTYSKEELLGYTLMEKYPGIENTALFKTLKQCMDERTAHHLETEFVFPDKSIAYFDLSIEPVPEGIFILSVDITERKKAEEKLLKANRLYAFLSAINQSIVQIKDERELLNKACSIAVEIGQFKMAWIGLLDKSGRLNMVNLGGNETATGGVQKYSGMDYASPLLRGTPTGKVLNTGNYAVSNDVQNDPAMRAWKEEFVQHGIKANLSLPIKKFGKIIGVLGFNSTTVNFFDKEEIALLDEAAGDISYAIENFEKEKLHTKAEAQVLHNEALLKKAQAVAHIGNWDVNFETGFGLWSDEQCLIYGLDPTDKIHSLDTWLSFIHPDDKDLAVNRIQKARQSGFGNSFNHRIKRKNGTIKHIHTQTTIELNESETSISMFGTSQDVTELKITEEKLLKANRLYAFISAINQSIVHIKNEQELLDKACNIASEIGQFKMAWVGLLDESGKLNRVSFSGDETAAKNILKQSLDVTDPALKHIPTVKVLNTGKFAVNNDVQDDPTLSAWKYEFIYQGICASISLPLFRFGKVTGILGFHAGIKNFFDKEEIALLEEAAGDISYAMENFEKEKMRHQAAENLLRNDLKLKEAQTIAKLGNWEIDMVNNKQSWSDELFNLFGFKSGEVTPTVESFLAMIHPDDAEFVNTQVSRAFETLTNNAPFTFRFTQKDGTIRYGYSESRFELDHKQKPIRIYGIVQDVTEKKEAENKIKELNENLEERVQERTADLTEANKALEAFSSAVSHDLQAPVRAVNSFAKIIQQDYAGKMDPEALELFGHIIDSGKRMSAIIEDLLKLAKYGKEKLKLERVDMSSLISGIWLNISRTTRHNAMLEMAELESVDVDMSMMQQVVVNLLSNAIKYSSKKEYPVLRVWCEQAKDKVTFYFKDNGAGFDMKDHDLLFGVFQRLHPAKDFEGTGVGLTLVKRIIEKHDGTIDGKGEVGEGATFWFTLPKRATE